MMQKETVTLYAIRYADSVLDEKWIFSGGREGVYHPISFVMFYIQDGARHILVDPGCDTMPGFDMKNYSLPVDALQKIGVTPDKITDVIITHAHHDHIDAVRHFPGSTVYIQEAEYSAGKRYIPEEAAVATFTQTCQLTSHVRIQKIGGHSIGSSIVLLEGLDKPYVICGDECYSKRCFTQQIPTGNFYNLEKSRQFIKTYQNDCTLLCHDPELYSGIIAQAERR